MALSDVAFKVPHTSSNDAVIAATALALDGQLAHRNTAAFDVIGLKLINPWDLDGIQT